VANATHLRRSVRHTFGSDRQITYAAIFGLRSELSDSVLPDWCSTQDLYLVPVRLSCGDIIGRGRWGVASSRVWDLLLPVSQAGRRAVLPASWQSQFRRLFCLQLQLARNQGLRSPRSIRTSIIPAQRFRLPESTSKRHAKRAIVAQCSRGCRPPVSNATMGCAPVALKPPGNRQGTCRQATHAPIAMSPTAGKRSMSITAR
jgi:hypothetical protein